MTAVDSRSGSGHRETVLVVAHPDDEILWFGSIVTQVDRVIIVFCDYAAEPGLGERRRRAMAALPYPNRCLGMAEAGSLGCAGWPRPQVSDCGLLLSRAPHDGVIDAYARNHQVIGAALVEELAGAAVVYTHNPWGEYGHEDHVQIFRVVEKLQQRHGFEMRVSGYASSRSAGLASRHARERAAEMPVDTALAMQVRRIYQDHGCWTWLDDWQWPAQERFFRQPALFADASSRSDLSDLIMVPAPRLARPGTRAPRDPALP